MNAATCTIQLAVRAFGNAFYKGNQAFFQHQDWLGSERIETSASGGVANRVGELVFGDHSNLGSGLDDYQFAGMDTDLETDSHHAQYRQYDSIAGRWMSPDPYDGSYDPSNPQSFNRYSYVLNNPLSFTDSTGLDGCDVNGDPIPCPSNGGWIGGLIAAIGTAIGSLFGIGGPSFHGTLQPRPGVTTTISLPHGPNMGLGQWDANGVFHPYNPYVIQTNTYGHGLTSGLLIAGGAATLGLQPDGRSLPSCLSLGLHTVGDDLNPFSPSAFTSFDIAKEAAAAGSMWRFNQALNHSMTRGLTYPNKSSIYRGLMSDSATFAKFADAMPILALDAAVIDGIHTEVAAECSYP